MRVARGRSALLGLGLAGVVVAACFSEHSATGPSSGGSVTCNLPLGPGVGGSTLVAIRDFAFLSNDVHVTAGSSVTWLNCEPAGTPAHTTTSNQGVWNSPLLQPGDAFTQTFSTPGVFPYICAVHPFMTARITVE
ncbi:MAG TPA: plastocyanin/azurin family copper-binding protein [Gemmatimonadales bacterium]|jgi:plastocyanin|nr:plastocyanin/azurin family copper-binding protein [Gemmatimonadales bacterium]